MDFAVIPAHLLFFALIALVMAASTWWSEPLLAFYYNRIKRSNPIGRSDYVLFDKILSQHIPYYRKLSLDGKGAFINRLFLFMRSKKFIGINGLQLTREMLVLVSAAAAQLTFGLKKFKISAFRTIYLSPDQFYAEDDFTQKYKGLVMTNGEIYLSWADFKKGFEVADDKYNLGLHEMAHALKTDLLRANNFDLRFSGYMDNWLLIGLPEFVKMNKKQESFLRAYGGRNIEEFFAVCVEHFFEAPAQFKRVLPDIYNHLCFLLHQNPLNDRNDYKFTEEFRREANRKSKFKMPRLPYPEYDGIHGFLLVVFAVTGFFFGITIITELVNLMDVRAIHFFIVAGGVFLLSAAIQFSYLLKARIYSLPGCLAVFLFGVLPVSYAAYLLINSYIPGEIKTETYKIHSVSPGDDLFWLENSAYANEPMFRSSDTYEFMKRPNANAQLAITVKRTPFGIKVFQANEIIYNEKDTVKPLHDFDSVKKLLEGE